MGVLDFPYNNVFTCTWGSYNNILFQVANSWLCVLYIGDFINFPSSFAYMVFLRIVLACCAFFFTTWAVWVLCSPDTALWNFIFFIYNVVRLIVLLYKEYHPPNIKPRFEKLYNTCYKSSGILVSTYNSLIEGGTVIATPHTESRILHKTLYSPNKILQIISGRITIRLMNGHKVRLREGDFINHNNWNFSASHVTDTTLVADYSVATEGLIVSWSYSRLNELLRGQERRLFSYLLLSNLNNLLLHLSNLLDQSSTTLDLTSNVSDNSHDGDLHDNDTQQLLLHKNNFSSDSCADSGIDHNGAGSAGSNNVVTINSGPVSNGPVSNGRVVNGAVDIRNEKNLENSWNDEVVECEHVGLLEAETGL